MPQETGGLMMVVIRAAEQESKAALRSVPLPFHSVHFELLAEKVTNAHQRAAELVVPII